MRLRLNLQLLSILFFSLFFMSQENVKAQPRSTKQQKTVAAAEIKQTPPEVSYTVSMSNLDSFARS